MEQCYICKIRYSSTIDLYGFIKNMITVLNRNTIRYRHHNSLLSKTNVWQFL